MKSQLVRLLQGYLLWKFLIVKHGIDYRKVVLVMSEENAEVDRQAIINLQIFMERKHAKSAIVFCRNQAKEEAEQMIGKSRPVSVEVLTDGEMAKLYSFYCFNKFFDNIVFTNTDTPKDNMLGKYLKETNVNEKEAVCLALYHLRCIPQ